LQAGAVQLPAQRPRAGQARVGGFEFQADPLRTPAGMLASCLAEVLHELGVGGLRLLLAPAVIVGSDAVVAALRQACQQALHGAQGHREEGDEVVRVGLRLPTLKKASCGWGQAARGA